MIELSQILAHAIWFVFCFYIGTRLNVRVICWWWNAMKQDWDDETIIKLINNYANKKE